MSYRNILLDLDGTLTDPGLGIKTCFRYALTKMNLPAPLDEELDWIIGPPLQDAFAQILATTDLATLTAAVGLFRERYSDVGWRENEVIAGIPEALSILKQSGFHLFVATSKPEPFANRILDHFGLAAFFAGIHGSHLDLSRSKKSEVIAHAIALHDLSATESLMIGDRAEDVIGAQANGMDCLGVTYGYGARQELTDAGAIGLADSPTGWLEYLHLARDPSGRG